MEGLLIQTFLNNKNKILSRKDLLEMVWNQKGFLHTRTVDMFISKIRKYIETDPSNPEYLLSVRGAGYIYKTE